MAMIDIKVDPSARDIKIFAALWALFFVMLGFIAFGTESALWKMAAFTGTCFLISIALNSDYPKKTQLLGMIIPLGLLSIWAFEHFTRASGGWFVQTRELWKGRTVDNAQLAVLAVVVAVGVLGGVAIFASRDLGRGLYRGWMFAALPIGWTISHVILGIVFYLVMTPIGLIMRVLGNDPMTRRPDPAAQTYWIAHQQQKDLKRYFRQF
jgi:hypothetical protein